MACCVHPLVHGDCAVPVEPEMVLYRKERKVGAVLEEIARFDDEELYRSINLTDVVGRGFAMACEGWHSLNDSEISLFTRQYHYILSDRKLRAQRHHEAFLKCLANNEKLPYLWQD